MDDDTRKELDKMLTAKGFEKYGGLMAAKFGGTAADYAPYLLASALEITWISTLDMLELIVKSPSLIEGLIVAKAVQSELTELMLSAGEAVGMERRKEALGEMAADTILQAPASAEVH